MKAKQIMVQENQGAKHQLDASQVPLYGRNYLHYGS